MSEPSSATNTPTQQDENHIIADRRAKLAEWRVSGQAYPNDFSRENTAGKIIELYDAKSGEELEATPVEVKVAGRVMLKRVMGKASFATISDVSGRIQLYVTRDRVGEESYTAFKRGDIGDIIGAVGTLFRTKTGELSVQCSEVRLLSKSLRPVARKIPWPDRPGTEVPHALPRPDHERAVALHLRRT